MRPSRFKADAEDPAFFIVSYNSERPRKKHLRNAWYFVEAFRASPATWAACLPAILAAIAAERHLVKMMVSCILRIGYVPSMCPVTLFARRSSNDNQSI